MAIDFPAIDPVAFHLGPLPIRWYALAYLAGFLLGWRYVLYLAKNFYENSVPAGRKAITALDIDDFLPWGVAGVILGGRFGYVLFYQLPLYLADPVSILMVWQGGMSFHGGALGMIGAMIIYARRRGISFLQLADMVCCAVPIGLFFGRIANFVNGELFGRVTDAPWGVVFPYGGDLPRHASQLYEAVLEGAVLFIVLAIMARSETIRKKGGVIAAAFLTGYGIARFIIEYFREPDAHIGLIGGFISMGQILCLPMIIGGIIAMTICAKRKHNDQPA